MKVKELFQKTNPDDIISAYFILYDFFNYIDIKDKPMNEKLQIKRNFELLTKERIKNISEIKDRDIKETIFVVKHDNDDYEEQDDFYYDSFCVKDADAKEKAAKVFTLWNGKDDVRIEHYDYSLQDLEDIANYNIAKASIDEYGPEICCAVILEEIDFYGYTDEGRAERIAEVNESLEQGLKDVKEGKYVSGDVFLKELMQSILDSCDSEEEREYILLQQEFEAKTRDFRFSYSKKIMEKNHERTINLIKKEYLE